MRRLMWRTSVDLPLPDSPMMQKISPVLTENEASATPTTQLKRRSDSAFPRLSALMTGRASDARFPKTFQTPLHSTEGRTAGLFIGSLAAAAIDGGEA